MAQVNLPLPISNPAAQSSTANALAPAFMFYSSSSVCPSSPSTAEIVLSTQYFDSFAICTRNPGLQPYSAPGQLPGIAILRLNLLRTCQALADQLGGILALHGPDNWAVGPLLVYTVYPMRWAARFGWQQGRVGALQWPGNLSSLSLLGPLRYSHCDNSSAASTHVSLYDTKSYSVARHGNIYPLPPASFGTGGHSVAYEASRYFGSDMQNLTRTPQQDAANYGAANAVESQVSPAVVNHRSSGRRTCQSAPPAVVTEDDDDHLRDLEARLEAFGWGSRAPSNVRTIDRESRWSVERGRLIRNGAHLAEQLASPDMTRGRSRTERPRRGHVLRAQESKMEYDDRGGWQ